MGRRVKILWRTRVRIASIQEPLARSIADLPSSNHPVGVSITLTCPQKTDRAQFRLPPGGEGAFLKEAAMRESHLIEEKITLILGEAEAGTGII